MADSMDTSNCTFSRRAFLAVAAVPAPGKSRKILVAGHPWVYAATRPGYDVFEILDQVFADMKAAGLDAVELMHTSLRRDNSVETIRELTGKHRLPVLGMSYSANMWDASQHEKIFDEARTLVARLAAAGGRTLGASVGDARGRKTPEQLDAQARLLRRLISMCADQGVVLNLHNHTYEVRDGEHDLNGTLERIPDVKLGPDLNWLLRGGVDPVDFIRRRGKNMVFAHLRDQRAEGRWPEAMGEGTMDYAAIGRELRKAGFAGDLAIELAHERDFKPTRPLRESFRLSRRYVRKAMGY